MCKISCRLPEEARICSTCACGDEAIDIRGEVDIQVKGYYTVDGHSKTFINTSSKADLVCQKLKSMIGCGGKAISDNVLVLSGWLHNIPKKLKAVGKGLSKKRLSLLGKVKTR